VRATIVLFALNEELTVVLYDTTIAGGSKRSSDHDLAHSRQVTYEDWRRRGLASRFLELLAIPLRDQL
jgi:cardiolipin synthase